MDDLPGIPPDLSGIPPDLTSVVKCGDSDTFIQITTNSLNKLQEMNVTNISSNELIVKYTPQESPDLNSPPILNRQATRSGQDIDTLQKSPFRTCTIIIYITQLADMSGFKLVFRCDDKEHCLYDVCDYMKDAFKI